MSDLPYWRLAGTLGGLYAGYAWERLGAGITFTGAALCAFAGMALLWLRLGDQNAVR